MRRRYKQQPLRTGIIRATLRGTGLFNRGEEHIAVYELAEWERLDPMSRVTVIEVTGVPDQKQAKSLFPAWVETSSVLWRESA